MIEEELKKAAGKDFSMLQALAYIAKVSYEGHVHLFKLKPDVAKLYGQLIASLIGVGAKEEGDDFILRR